MPVIKQQVVATTPDALLGQKFKVQARPCLVTLYASGQAAGALIGFSVGSSEYLVDALVNLEQADVVDSGRDMIMMQERVPPGEYFLPITLGGTDVTYLLIIEPL